MIYILIGITIVLFRALEIFKKYGTVDRYLFEAPFRSLCLTSAELTVALLIIEYGSYNLFFRWS